MAGSDGRMDHTIARLGLALGIGLLVGLERGWRVREAADNNYTAGIRTFGWRVCWAAFLQFSRPLLTRTRC